jgi:uncharacterized protein (TIGR00369 family)
MVALSALLPDVDLSQATPLIRRQWQLLSALPGGRGLFSRFIGLIVPYTGSIGAQVEELREGYARVALEDRRAVRNHLRSVHAIALANLVELTGNLAFIFSLPLDARVIVSGISIEYLKKARGRLVAECHCPVPETAEKQEYLLEVAVRNEVGETVAKGQLRSLVGPSRKH